MKLQDDGGDPTEVRRTRMEIQGKWGERAREKLKDEDEDPTDAYVCVWGGGGGGKERS